MAFIEVKVTDRAGGLFKSKKAVKDAVAANPAAVVFNSVGMGPQFNGTAADFLARDLAGTKLTIVGPDPFRDRRWYGTVEVKNGKLRVS